MIFLQQQCAYGHEEALKHNTCIEVPFSCECTDSESYLYFIQNNGYKEQVYQEYMVNMNRNTCIIVIRYICESLCQNQWWDILMIACKENLSLASLHAFDLCIRTDK